VTNEGYGAWQITETSSHYHTASSWWDFLPGTPGVSILNFSLCLGFRDTDVIIGSDLLRVKRQTRKGKLEVKHFIEVERAGFDHTSQEPS
jgi:hypothetical protein